MVDRVYNFSAGPSMLPIEVLNKIESDLYNYKGSGMSVMEMSHRSKLFSEILCETKDAIRRVMNVSENYEILFIQGGATEQFSAIPLNLIKKGKADYIVTGSFSSKAAKEAKKFIQVNIAWDGKDNNYSRLPLEDELNISNDSDYIYFCMNNTAYGSEWKYIPKTDKPLVCDMSSVILAKEVDVNDFGMIFAGAQKNMGISGIAIVIIRKDLLDTNLENNIPILMNYKKQAENDSMSNTPSTFAIYVCGEVVKWVEHNGGVKAMVERNKKKAELLYEVLDNSSFYTPYVDRSCRSNTNVTFKTPSPELDAEFIKQAKENGMENLKGYKDIGGIRASIYNAMPIEGVEKLVAFMKEFEKENI